MADKVGQADIRGENINKVVKVWTQKKFKLMPFLKQIKSTKWTETYYREDKTILTAGGTRNIKEIGRLSEFPSVERSWTKESADHYKYGSESEIPYEDVLTSAISVQARTMDGVAESIVNAADIAIYKVSILPKIALT